jgi:RluA family pseudouridine synthase
MSIQKFTFTHKTDTDTLLSFIALKLTVSKNKAKQLLDRRMVFVNKKRVWIASYQLNKGDVIEVITREIKPQKLDKDSILFKDNHYLIVSKPPDIITNGLESLEENLRTYFNDNRIHAVHRLDKDTSGVVIFAMNKDAFERMKTLFKKNLMKKVYRVIVRGDVGKQTFTINTPIHGQQAVTHVKLLKRGKDTSYLEVNIETGRTHQIRIHLASVGHPVIGETEYDRKPIEHPLLRQIRRQMLHAYQISFAHPYTQKMVSVTASIPEDFNQCLKTLGLAD